MVPSPRHVLLLEDNPDDAHCIRQAVRSQFPEAEVVQIASRAELLDRLDAGPIDIVLSDSRVPGCEGLKGFHLARGRHPHVPFVYVSNNLDIERDLTGLRALGVTACLSTADLAALGPAIEAALIERDRARRSMGLMAGYESLVHVIADLARAHDLSSIVTVVRAAVRELIGSDGSTFVLRDADTCLYVDEDGIDPLWLGRRVPMGECLSGWAMRHRQPAVAFDVHDDPRVAASCFIGTPVRAALVVPIRAMEPIGTVGAYWAEPREPYPQEVRLLQALADATAGALDNARVYQGLEHRAREARSDLEVFTRRVTQALHAPIHQIRSLLTSLDQRDGNGVPHVDAAVTRMDRAAVRMERMLDGLATISCVSRLALTRETVDLSHMAHQIADQCRLAADRAVDFVCPDGLIVEGDRSLLRHALHSLLENAWKFSSLEPRPRVEVGMQLGEPPVFFVRDNGIGFDDADHVFEMFHQSGAGDELSSVGVGLSIAERAIHKHSGRIWAKSRPNAGATFYFTLGPARSPAFALAIE